MNDTNHTSTTTTNTTLNDPFDNVVIQAMSHIYGYIPRPFQLETVSRIIRMKSTSNDTSRQVRPTMLVQGTGGGKTSVYQTIGCIMRGVHLIIQNTLSLSSDQLLKAQELSKNVPNVFTVQLDSIKTSAQRRALIEAMEKFHDPKSNIIFFIFSSPEALLRPQWLSLFTSLRDKLILKLITIDEVHLFVIYGLTFRFDFLKLKKNFFEKVLYSSSPTDRTMKVPLLVMTATFNLKLQLLLQKMIGINFENKDTIWSGPESFARRNIDINCSFTSYKMKVVKDTLLQQLSPLGHEKAIVYSSVAKSTEQIQTEIDGWLNIPSVEIVGDTILINGLLEADWKFISTQHFSTYLPSDEDLPHNSNTFFPRILVATSGCIGAGLDCHHVNTVIREGVPSSILDLIQEMGRCGRGNRSSNEEGTNDKNIFQLILNVESFHNLVRQIFEPANDDDENSNSVDNDDVVTRGELQQILYTNLLDVLALLTLPKGCWHLQLELFSSPFTSREDYGGTR